MKKERSFTYLIKDKSKKAVRAQHPHIFMTLMALAMMILAPQGASARELGPWDFYALATACGNNDVYGGNNSEGVIPLTSNRYSAITAAYYGSNNTTIGSMTIDLSRFAFRSGRDRGWYLYAANSGGYSGSGLFIGNGTPEFAITNLRPDDVVKVTFKGSGNRTVGLTFVSGSAKKGNNTLNSNDVIETATGGNEAVAQFTATASGDVIISTNGGKYSTFITYISIERPDVASYDYSPTNYEVYDIYYSLNGTTYGTEGAGFQLNGREAVYLNNLSSGLVINNRIAVSQSSLGNPTQQWYIDRGVKAQWAWHNISITNLHAGDRVRIYYTGEATFSSNGQNGAYNGSPAFIDYYNDGIKNNGENDTSDDGDRNIYAGLAIEDAWVGGVDNNMGQSLHTSQWYVMEDEGHLDIGLNGAYNAQGSGSRIVKVEIYSDHPAIMVDRYNGHAPEGYTAYFDITGQLQGKEHIMEGGLEIHVGNENNDQHSIVTMTDEGPASYVFDQERFKMARIERGHFDVFEAYPGYGTYYKFIPQVKGRMTLRFKAYSVDYLDYFNHNGDENIPEQWNTPNEQQRANISCPYYLMEQSSGQTVPTQLKTKTLAHGVTSDANNDHTFKDIEVVPGKTYWLYGWWSNGTELSNFNDGNHAAGVAELIDVTFKPDKMVYPLAKTVVNGTTSDGNLAEVSPGTTTNDLHIKKMSANILSCEPYIENEGPKHLLKIRNIQYKEGENKGGVILIKIGDPNNYDDPLYALTIAYSAQWNNGEGHKWDFSDKTLNGLEWNNTSAQADITPFDTYYTDFFTDGESSSTNSNSLLYKESHRGTNADGSEKSDWKFTYRVEKGDKKQDPMFLNKYGMDGDNADMMWDTEGLVISTDPNQSCIFNEYKNSDDEDEENAIDRTSGVNVKDPDRYVGILPGGEFRIPRLMKDDRVIIYMGSAKSSGSDACYFNIENAYDALHNLIDPKDTYKAGGSMWNADIERTEQAHGDPYYRFCYHFFATGDQEHEGEPADMIFRLEDRGSLVKLYSIEIYHGDRRLSNNINKKGSSPYVLINEKGTLGSNGKSATYNMHFLGKGESPANCEIIAHSGNISNGTNVSLSGRDIILQTKVGDFGDLRVRCKDYEMNGKYVADFADRNFTVGYRDKVDSYPYTWDFTDMKVFSETKIRKDYTDYVETTDSLENKGYDLSMWDENMAMILQNPDFFDAADNQTYQIFQQDKEDNAPAGFNYGNQLWAYDEIIPETRGLWFFFDNNDGKHYNGAFRIAADGIHLASNRGQDWWNYKMVVPDVPAGAEVYLRMARDYEAVPDDLLDAENQSYIYTKFKFNHMSTKATIGIEQTNICKFFDADDGSGDKIVAITNNGETSNLTFTLNGWTLKKLGVSLDRKKIGATGYATESRERVIDHRLTSFFTGKPVEAYIGKMNSGHTLLQLTQIDIMDKDNDPTNPADASHLGKGCILYNNAGESVTDKSVSVFDDGTFNLFVPDMHLKDESTTRNTTGDGNEYTFTTNFASDNDLKACVPVLHLDNNSSNFTRYILSAQPYKYKEGEGDGGSASGRPLTEDGKLIGFYRVNPKTGSNMKGNQAYIEVSNSASARVDITFDMFEDIDDGVATKVEGVENADEGNGSYMTISGQRVNAPAQSGIYIKNGKKIVVK